MEELEARHRKLLRETDSSEDKGKIYAEIASMYASSGIQRYLTEVIEYCQKALQLPLDISTACQMYVYWGEALEAKYRDATGEDFIAKRQQIVIPYLTGLKLVIENQTTRKRREPPAVSRYRYDGPPNDPEYQAMLKKHEEEITARENVMLQNKLVDYRNVFTSKCVDLYSREPFAQDELQQLAGEILENEDAAKEILTEVRARIDEKDNPMHPGARRDKEQSGDRPL